MLFHHPAPEIIHQYQLARQVFGFVGGEDSGEVGEGGELEAVFDGDEEVVLVAG